MERKKLIADEGKNNLPGKEGSTINLDYFPKNGLGFHGTSDHFLESIRTQGLHLKNKGECPLKDFNYWPIFYSHFDPFNNAKKTKKDITPADFLNGLERFIELGIDIAKNLGGGIHGGNKLIVDQKTGEIILARTTKPLLCVFIDKQKRGKISHAIDPTKLIEFVPPEDIICLQTLESTEEMATFINKVTTSLCRTLKIKLS